MVVIIPIVSTAIEQNQALPFGSEYRSGLEQVKQVSFEFKPLGEDK